MSLVMERKQKALPCKRQAQPALEYKSILDDKFFNSDSDFGKVAAIICELKEDPLKHNVGAHTERAERSVSLIRICARKKTPQEAPINEAFTTFISNAEAAGLIAEQTGVYSDQACGAMLMNLKRAKEVASSSDKLDKKIELLDNLIYVLENDTLSDEEAISICTSTEQTESRE